MTKLVGKPGFLESLTLSKGDGLQCALGCDTAHAADSDSTSLPGTSGRIVFSDRVACPMTAMADCAPP
jgi:hypothetical protein